MKNFEQTIMLVPIKYGDVLRRYIGYRVNTSDVDPDWLYPDPDADPQNLINPDQDPDPGRIQVNKISKFSKHLLIFKSKK